MSLVPVPADPVVSPADTSAYKRLAAMLAEGEGLDDAQPMYSPLGELRAFKAEMDALLAVGERDKAEIERLRKALDRTEDEWERAWERDRRQITRLTEALNELAQWHDIREPCDNRTCWHCWSAKIARAVLAGEEDARG